MRVYEEPAHGNAGAAQWGCYATTTTAAAVGPVPGARRPRRQAREDAACERPAQAARAAPCGQQPEAVASAAASGVASGVASPLASNAPHPSASSLEALSQYAHAHSLPPCYLQQHVAAVGEANLTLDAFKASVARREASLRAAFAQASMDGDTVTFEALRRAAPRVCVLAPAGGCSCTTVSFRADEVQRMLNAMGRRRAASRASDGDVRAVTYEEFRDFFADMPPDAIVWDYWARSSEACLLECGCGTVDVQSPSARGGNPLRHLVAGAVAGAASRTITAPLETIRLQAVAAARSSAARAVSAGAAAAPPSLAATVRGIAEREGVTALWRGNTAMVMRSAPQKGIDFFTYNAYKSALGELATRLGVQKGAARADGADGDALATRLTAGALAGATSTVLLYPLDVVRTRLAVGAVPGLEAAGARPGGVSAVVGAAATIARKEGVGALYRGLGYAVAAIIPEAAVTYGTYDALSNLTSAAYRRRYGSEPPVALGVVCGAAAATIGQTLAYPLEVVTRRVSLGKGAVTATGARANLLAQLAAVVRTEGLGALYSGISAATLRVLPMGIVSFTVYEATKRALERSALAPLPPAGAAARPRAQCVQ